MHRYVSSYHSLAMAYLPVPNAGKAEAGVTAAAKAAADWEGAAHSQQGSVRGRQSISGHVQVVDVACKLIELCI